LPRRKLGGKRFRMTTPKWNVAGLTGLTGLTVDVDWARSERKGGTQRDRPAAARKTDVKTLEASAMVTPRRPV